MTSLLQAIGRTPLVRLERVRPRSGAEVWLKLEYLNPSGSLKDRMALAMIQGAERDGLLTSAMTVVEYTGGSMGAALALVCRAKGYRVRLVTSTCFSVEKLRLMANLGAEVEVYEALVPGKVTAEDFQLLVECTAELASFPGYFGTDQLTNAYIVPSLRDTLGSEIWEQTRGRLAAFCTGVGSGGSLMGVAEALRGRCPETLIVALEPAASPGISNPEAGRAPFVMQGWTGVKPPLYIDELIDEVEVIGDDESLEMTRRLAREEGIFAGISTGANVVGALRIADRLPRNAVVVSLAVDTGFKYMSGSPYLNDDWVTHDPRTQTAWGFSSGDHGATERQEDLRGSTSDHG